MLTLDFASQMVVGCVFVRLRLFVLNVEVN